MLMYLCLLLAFVLSIAAAGLYRQNRCYSCMSPMYSDLFANGLDRYFHTPRNFSDQCNEPMNTSDMHVIPCRTICLTIQQDLYILGQPTGRRLFMRGCAQTMSKRGILNHTLAMFDRYDICRVMNANDLFQNNHENSQRVKVCSCLGDRCNGAPSGSSSPSTLLLLLLTFLLTLRI